MTNESESTPQADASPNTSPVRPAAASADAAKQSAPAPTAHTAQAHTAQAHTAQAHTAPTATAPTATAPTTDNPLRIPQPTQSQKIPGECFDDYVGVRPGEHAASPGTNTHQHPVQNKRPVRAATSPLVREIYQAIISECGPYVLPAPLQKYRDKDAYTGLPDPKATLAKLRQKFDDQSLKEARVLTQKGALKPSLVGPEAIVIALRDEQEGLPYDLMTAIGCIFGRTPAIAVISDVVGTTPPPEGNALWDVQIAFTMQDVVALRALGFRAAVAAGLTELTGPRLDHLFKVFESTTRRGLSVHTESISTFSQSAAPGLAPLQSFLEQVERNLELEIEHATQFIPTDELLSKLAFASKTGGVTHVRRLLSQALDDERYVKPLLRPQSSKQSDASGDGRGKSAEAPRAASFAETPLTSGDANRQRTKEVEQSAKSLGAITSKAGNRDERRRLREERERVLDRELLLPLRVQALSAPNPFARNVTMQLAENFATSHRQMFNITERIAMQPDPDGGIPQPPEIIPAKDIHALAVMNSSLCKLVEVVIKCWTPNLLLGGHGPKRTPQTSNLPRSDSTKGNLPR